MGVASPAQALTIEEGAEAARCDGCPENLFGDDGIVKDITNKVLLVVGVVAVIMLIIGGIRYMTSGGDSKKVTDAKNTVLYAIIGLIIVILSAAIVNFVTNTLSPTKTNTDSSNTSSSSANTSSSTNKSEQSQTQTQVQQATQQTVQPAASTQEQSAEPVQPETSTEQQPTETVQPVTTENNDTGTIVIDSNSN